MTRFYISQIILALEHLHANDCIYRDLKPENILLEEDGYIKITDFGLSKMEVRNRNAQTLCGTNEYIPPEVLKREKYGKSYDWWSLGNLLYELLVGKPPFYNENNKMVYDDILSKEPDYPAYLTEDVIDLLKKLLNKD